MKISVIGAGYVGLVTAAGLARNGHSVVCIDVDELRVNTINQGVSPIYEAGLDDLLSSLASRSGGLRASTAYREILDTDLSLICVDTPANSNGSINVGHVRDAAKRIGQVLRSKNGYHLVATRSTIIPGTTKDVIIPLLEKYSKRKAGKDIGIAYNPEFLQEGKAVQAFFSPDRIIIGELDKRAGDLLVDVYKDIVAPVFRTDITTAEMIKYASNAFLATKISFINEIANICQKLGADVYDVVKGLSFDYRIGDKFLSAGIGFGGSCLPKDLRALVYASENRLDYPTALLKAVLDVNEAQALKLVEIAERKLGDLDGRKITVLGLAFKPNTDDVRDAPAIRIIRALLEKGAVVKAYDPEAMDNAKNVLPKEVKYCKSAKNAISGSDCVLIVTEWEEFRDENLYRGKIVIDGRRALDPKKAREVCDYQGVCW
jgi:UDPglucose 6-dehydrogenase